MQSHTARSGRAGGHHSGSKLSFDVLSDSSVMLTLSEGCLETTARRAHRELTMALLEDRVTGAALAVVLATLESFLLTADFAALRAEHPQLAGATACRIRLFRSDAGPVKWEVVPSG